MGEKLNALALGAIILGVTASAGQPAEATRSNTLPPTQFREKVWTRDHGLPDNEVTALLQSADGYVWIATRSGLCRFDGLNFRTFSHLTDAAFTSDYCTALAEEADGAIWIGTKGGLIKRAQGVFSHVQAPDNLARSEVWSLHWGKQTGLWVLTGSYIWQKQGGSFRHWPLQEPFHPFSICETKDGNIQVGTQAGLTSFVFPGGERLEQPIGFPRHRQVWGLIPRADGSLFALADSPPDPGMRPYSIQDAGWIALSPSAPAILPRRTYFAVEDSAGQVWVPGRERGLQIVTSEEIRPAPVAQDLVAACILHDRDRNVWVGTEGDGLHLYIPLPFRTLGEKEGLDDAAVWAFEESAAGGVWVGTDGGLVHYHQGVRARYTTAEGLPRNAVRALAEDGAGQLWIGTGKGIARLSRAGELQSWTFSGPPNPDDPDQISINKVRALAPARDGSVWIGVEAGLYSFNTSGQVYYDQTRGLPGSDVRALCLDQSDNLWLGLLKGGLVLHSNKQFFQFTNGLSSDAVCAIHRSGDGTLWLGTERGLNRMKDGAIFNFGVLAKTPLIEVINHLVEDDRGHLWLSLENGVCRVSISELNAFASGTSTSVPYTLFDASDGIPDRATNGRKSQPASIKLRNGELWFATSKGVAIIDPRENGTMLAGPPVVIEEVRANDQPVLLDGNLLTLDDTGATQGTQGVRLAPGGGRVLEFHFTANSFRAPEKCRFRFRLDGYDAEWREAGTRRIAFYTNLAPGEYRFRVLASDHRNMWSEQEASFAFVLAPFFYQTWLFRLSAFGFLAGLAAVGHAYRVRHHRQIEQLQGRLALAQERTRVAQDLHDGVGSALTQLRLLAALAEREQNEANGSLDAIRKIGLLSHTLNENLREIIWLARPESQTLGGLLARTCERAEALAEPAGVQCRFDLPAEVPEAELPATLSQNLHFALKEALHNAVKHSQCRTIRVRATRAGSEFEVQVQDDGIGFDPKRVRPGNGMGNMRQRLESAGGVFELRSKPGGGSALSFRFSLGQEQSAA